MRPSTRLARCCSRLVGLHALCPGTCRRDGTLSRLSVRAGRHRAGACDIGRSTVALADRHRACSRRRSSRPAAETAFSGRGADRRRAVRPRRRSSPKASRSTLHGSGHPLARRAVRRRGRRAARHGLRRAADAVSRFSCCSAMASPIAAFAEAISSRHPPIGVVVLLIGLFIFFPVAMILRSALIDSGWQLGAGRIRRPPALHRRSGGWAASVGGTACGVAWNTLILGVLAGLITDAAGPRLRAARPAHRACPASG